MEGRKSFFDAGNIRRMDWTDEGTPGVWRRKRPEQAPPSIPSLSERLTKAPPAASSVPTAPKPPQAQAAATQPQPEPTPSVQEAATATPPQAPSDAPSSSQAKPSQPQFLPTLEGIMKKLKFNHELIFEGFSFVHERLRLQRLKLERVDAQIQGMRLHIGFTDANIATIVKQYQREEEEAEEARKKQEEEKQQKEQAQTDQAAESPHMTLQELNQQGLEREQQEVAAKEEQENGAEEERVEDSEQEEKEDEEDDEEEDSEEEQSSESNGSSSPDKGQFEVKERAQSTSSKSEEV